MKVLGYNTLAVAFVSSIVVYNSYHNGQCMPQSHYVFFVEANSGRNMGMNIHMSLSETNTLKSRQNNIFRIRGGDSGNGPYGSYRSNSGNQFYGNNHNNQNQNQQQPQGQWQQQQDYQQQQQQQQQHYAQQQQQPHNYGQQQQSDNYYYNQQAQEVGLTSDPKLEDDTAAAKISPLPPGWSEHIDPASGQPYYYNSNDGTTTWDRPETDTSDSSSDTVNDAANEPSPTSDEEEKTNLDNQDSSSHDESNYNYPTQEGVSPVDATSSDNDNSIVEEMSTPISSNDPSSYDVAEQDSSSLDSAASTQQLDGSRTGDAPLPHSNGATQEEINVPPKTDTSNDIQYQQQWNQDAAYQPQVQFDNRYQQQQQQQQQLPPPTNNFDSRSAGPLSPQQQYNDQYQHQKQNQFLPNIGTNRVQHANDRQQQQQAEIPIAPNSWSNPDPRSNRLEVPPQEKEVRPSTNTGLGDDAPKQQSQVPIQSTVPNSFGQQQQRPPQHQQLPQSRIQQQPSQPNDPRLPVQGRDNSYDGRQMARPEDPNKPNLQQQQQQLPHGPWGVQRPPPHQGGQFQPPPIQSNATPPPFGVTKQPNQLPPHLANRGQYQQQPNQQGNAGLQQPPTLQRNVGLQQPPTMQRNVGLQQPPTTQQRPPTLQQRPPTMQQPQQRPPIGSQNQGQQQPPLNQQAIQQQSAPGGPTGQSGIPPRWQGNPYGNGNNPPFNPNNPVDIQRPSYGRPQYTGYNGPPGQGQQPQQLSTERALVPVGQDNSQQANPVQEALGRTWEGLLGFRDKTKEVVGKASETVATSARDATQTISASGSSWWGIAKERFSSIFEPGPEDEAPYNLASIYGVAPQSPQMSSTNAPGNQQQQQQQEGQQQRQYPIQQQQQGGSPPGQIRYPPEYAGRPGYPPQSGYPPRPQQQGQPGQQQQQPQQQLQQFQQAPGRVPPGYTAPQPRADVAYPMQQQNPQAANRPPFQGQWRGGPPPGHRLPPPQQQQSQFDPRLYPQRDGSLPAAAQNGIPLPQQNQAKQEPKQEKKQDWFDHPGLTGGF